MALRKKWRARDERSVRVGETLGVGGEASRAIAVCGFRLKSACGVECLGPKRAAGERKALGSRVSEEALVLRRGLACDVKEANGRQRVESPRTTIASGDDRANEAACVNAIQEISRRRLQVALVRPT